MLQEIIIENVAVIEKASADFSTGFTVLTGETGAGKSILIDSINAILGNRTSRDIVRSGAQKARIWARFRDVAPVVLQQLAEAGYESDGELLLYREITTEGKSACRINGMPATAAMLRDVCGGLVNIHGQHDNQSLLNPARHIHLLDAFARNEGLLATYGQAYTRWQEVRREMRGLSLDEGEKARKMDLLRFETEEIDAAGLEPGEEELLLERREVVRNSQRIVEAMDGAYQALNGDDEGGGAVVLLADAMRRLQEAATFAPELARMAETLGELYYNASELASDIGATLSDFEFGDESMEEIEQRLDLLYRLKQKYGASVEAVMEYGQAARESLEGIETADERLAELTTQEAQCAGEVQKLCEELTQSRQAAFEKLDSEIAEALGFLNMPGITMALHNSRVEPGPLGWDELEFYISTNPGEKPKPLAKIASGGELARIMLALKSALADRDDVPTVIYDEIDTGISGLAAGRVGQLMRDTAKGRQVICVTHTAQIAAFAQRHLLIEKRVENGRTYTDIGELDEAARTGELARIISGDKVTDTALANAREMLQMARA